MNPSLAHSGQSPRQQRGATLAIVLILLVIMTLLGLVSLRIAQNQEGMNASLYDRSLQFQAAEAALRAAERTIGPGFPTRTAATCSAGICGFPDTSAAGVWNQAAIWTGANSLTVEIEGDDRGLEPRYIIEWLADQVPLKDECTTSIDVSVSTCTGTGRRFRITALSNAAAAGQASVMLQSVYIAP